MPIDEVALPNMPRIDCRDDYPQQLSTTGGTGERKGTSAAITSTAQVLGLVAHPGNFELPIGRAYRVRDAIAAANGVTNKVMETVLVCRQIPNNEKRALIQVSLREAARDQAENMVLVPGDIVSVEPTRVTVHDKTSFDGAGYEFQEPLIEPIKVPKWYESEMLPKPLRQEGGGHDGSHPFLTHEFIDAVLSERRPTVDVYEAVAYTAPGIVTHQSSLKGGEQLKIPDFGRRT
jgi:hypothetical protein